MPKPDKRREHELVVDEALAQQAMHGGQGFLTVAPLMGTDFRRRQDRRTATKRQNDRGWLVASSAGQIEDHHECILMGQRLRRAHARVAALGQE